MGHLDGRIDDRVVAFVRRQRRHEGAVDLQLRQRKGMQIRKRRVSRAEIINGKTHPQRRQTLHLLLRKCRVVHHRRFGNLQFERTGLDTACGKRGANRLIEHRVVELMRGEIDRNARKTQTGLTPLHPLVQRVPQYPTTDGRHQPDLFGNRDEACWRNLSQLFIAPTQEYFCTDDRACPIANRLKYEMKRIMVDRKAQPLLQTTA